MWFQKRTGKGIGSENGSLVERSSSYVVDQLQNKVSAVIIYHIRATIRKIKQVKSAYRAINIFQHMKGPIQLCYT